jgi:hypothetical protein
MAEGQILNGLQLHWFPEYGGGKKLGYVATSPRSLAGNRPQLIGYTARNDG